MNYYADNMSLSLERSAGHRHDGRMEHCDTEVGQLQRAELELRNRCSWSVHSSTMLREMRPTEVSKGTAGARGSSLTLKN